MKDRIELRRIYDELKDSFPGCEHNDEVYLIHIWKALRKDPTRTKSVVDKLEELGLDYPIHRTFPLNDFVRGSVRYLEQMGVGKDIADKFLSKHDDRMRLFQD